MLPAPVYRISAGVTALLCLCSVGLELLSVLHPEAVHVEPGRDALATLALGAAPLYVLQALAGAELAGRKMHPLLTAKARRMAVIGFIGASQLVPLALLRLGEGLLNEDSALGTIAGALLWLYHGLILCLVALNARDGVRFKSMSSGATSAA